MLFVPISFVVALLLTIIIAQKIRRMERPSYSDWLFIALMGTYALQSIIIGLRWGYQFNAVMPFQILLATLLATLAFLAFQSLTDSPHQKSPWQLLHLTPTLLAGLFFMIKTAPLGLVITATFLGYGFALLNMARRGPDILVKSRLDGVVLSYRALWITGVALILSAILDMFINLDFDIFQGDYAGLTISIFNTIILFALGGAVAVTGSIEDEGEAINSGQKTGAIATPQDAEIAEQIDTLMISRELFKDADLNLSRLARRLGLPARHVSEAINRTKGMSVSHYVNKFRIEEACRLLEKTDEPVTQLMFDAGFISKSNFNREFLRITGQSPTQWRKSRI